MGSWRNLFVGLIFYVVSVIHLNSSCLSEDFAGILFSLTGMTIGLLISIQLDRMPE